MKKIAIRIVLFFTSAILAVYLSFVFILPVIINSKTASGFLLSKLEKKGYLIDVSNLRLAISPFLKINLSCDKVSMANDFIFDAEKLSIYLPLFSKEKMNIKADKFYFKLSNKPNSGKTAKKSFDFTNLPDINAGYGVIELLTGSKVSFNNLSIKDNVCSFDLNIESVFLKDKVTISKNDKILLTKNGFSLDDYKIKFKDSMAVISGELSNNGYNFTVKGKNLPVYDIENLALLMIKQKSDKKNFIENFTDFSGRISLDLKVNSGGIEGTAVIDELMARTVPLCVPVYFKKLVFNFKDKNIFMNSKGVLGGENVDWSFYLTGLATSDMEISGSVHSDISDNFAKNYIDDLYILGTIGLNVDYLVDDGVVNIIYSANIPKGSDISYNGAHSGLASMERTINATTSKKGDVITLVNYDYSVNFNDKEEKLIYGNGVFTKRNGKYAIDKITGKTMVDAPVSLLGFIENRLKGGFFNGDIEYDFVNNKFLGSIVLQNSGFKQFKISKAAIFGDNDMLSILADGMYKGEALSCILDMKNRLKDHFYIYKLDLFLKKYVMLPSGKKVEKKFSTPGRLDSSGIKNAPPIEIKDFQLRLDEFKKDRIEVNNIILRGSVKNSVLYFDMPSTFFADGTLKANGYADFDNSFFDVDFTAEDIDADIAASQIFNLDNHFFGKTSASLHVKSPFELTMLEGHGKFHINNGAILNFGNKEFTINSTAKKRKFKFSLADIVKIRKSFNVDTDSTITGEFDMLNEQIKNAVLYIENNMISAFIEGEYNAKTGYSNLDIWGRYDRDIERKITIFHIPVGWLFKFIFRITQAKDTYVDKLLKIPPVKNDNMREFNINLTGNVNNPKDVKVLFKKIKN